MSRSFLTGLNLNKNELLNARIQNLSTPPASPVAGQIYYDTDTNQITLWNGTAWVSLAAGGDTATMITNAIDALTTDVIEEGTTNKYFTDERAQDAVANAISAGTHSNITITYDDANNKFTFAAENGVADSTTDNLTEGTTNKYFTDERAQDAIGTAISNGAQTGITVTYTDASNKIDFSVADQWTGKTTSDLTEGTNLYFTDERAQDAVGNSVGTGLSYNDTTGAISVDTATIASKTYVDGLVQGLSVKDSVRAATAVAGTLATSFANGSTVGGVTVATNDRILVKNQVDAGENGIYVVNASGAPTRAADADPVASELEKGSYVLVTDGTYAATGWIVTAYALGATTWTQFSAANEYTAGTNIAIAGNAISFSGVLPVANGGTNANTAAGAKTSLGFTTKYAVNNTLLEPASNVVTMVVTHGMASRDVAVQVYELSTYDQVEVDVTRTNTAAVTLTWVATANVAADTYRVVVIG
jgi:hypothetical protein